MMASCSILTPYMQFTVTEKDTGCGTAVYTRRKGIGGYWIWLCFSFYVKSIGCQHRRAQDCLCTTANVYGPFKFSLGTSEQRNQFQCDII